MIVRLDSIPVLPKLPDARRLDEAEREVATRGTALTAAPVEAKTSTQQSLGAVLKKAGEEARAFGDSLTARFDEARKNSAREQVAQIRERIKMLKQLILLFGGSKALLRELKQLAGTLASAADVLKEGGGGGSAASGAEGFLYTETGIPAETGKTGVPADGGSQTYMNEAQSEPEQQAAQVLAVQAKSELVSLKAEPQSPVEATDKPQVSDPQPTLAFAPVSGNQQDAQRRADAEQLAKALSELKALVTAAKAAQRKRDRDDQKRFAEIDEHLEQIGAAVHALSEPAPLVEGGFSVRA